MTSNARLESLRADGATIVSYRAAKRTAKKTGRTVYSDSGDGFVSEHTYCAWRKRVISTLISPTGERVV